MAIDDIGCRNDFDCVSNAMCIPADGVLSTTKACVGYFSQDNGVEVDDCRITGGISLTCASGFCIDKPNDSPKGTCGPAPYNINRSSNSCTSDDFCAGWDGTKQYLGTCRCGYNAGGFKYCDQFLGS